MTHRMTEQEMAEGCRRGDNAARKALYERFAGSLLALCRRYAGSSELAEDWLHDNFLNVYSSFSRFAYRGPGSLEAWLRRVFVNGCLSRLEQERKDAALFVPGDGALPETPDEDPPPDVPAEVVARLIEDLAEGYRTVLNLYLVEGWSHKEIAHRLHIKESTSASQYMRARKILKNRITDYLNANDT